MKSRHALLAAWCMAQAFVAPHAASAQYETGRDGSAAHALVLSGGGARGLAHAGSLVALEQLGYETNVVVGTSMGAIIGALYASGLSPDEIWHVIAAENWLERFSAEAIALGQARQPVRPILAFGMNRGRVHEGFVSTTRVNLRLVELLFDAGARARNDFDRLPLRYRAVATDLSTGAEVVLARGDLPRAVRASMAVPGAFAPVPWDSLVLGDGGISNNLPVSVARTLTAAPIIAIDVLRPAPALEERGPLDLGIRAVRLLIENARPDSIDPDILILPRIAAGFGETRFPANALSLLRAGHAAVIEQVPAPRVRGRPVAVRPAPGVPPLQINRLQVNAGDPAADRLVGRIMAAAVGDYDPDEIIQRTAALYGTGLFSAVWPRLAFDEGDSGPATLVVEAFPVAQTSVSAALRWDNDVGGGAWASLRHGTRLTTPVDLRLGIILDELSHRASLEGSIFSAWLPGLIWNAGTFAYRERIREFDGAAVLDTLRVQRAGGWAGAELHGPIRNTFVSLLARVDHVRRPDAGNGWSYGPYLRVSPPPSPDRITGIEPLIEWESRIGDVHFGRWQVRTGVGWTTGAVRTALLAHMHVATRNAPADVRTGASPELAPWLRAGSMRSRFVAGAGIDMAHPIVLDGYLRLRLRTFGATVGPAASGASGRDLVDQATWRSGGEIGAIWPTVIGPIAVGVAAGRGAAWRINLGVGAGF